MAGAITVMFGQQVDLQIGHQWTLAQEVVPDQAVEVERGRGADVDLDVGDLGQLPGALGQRASDAGGLLEGGALGHVDDHLHLALVVVGEHLDPYQTNGHQSHGGDEHHAHQSQKRPATPGSGQQRPEQTLVGPHEPGFGTSLGVVPCRSLGHRFGMLSEEFVRQPG